MRSRQGIVNLGQMKTNILWLPFTLFLALGLGACTKKQVVPHYDGEVKILAYSSMGSEGGFLKSIRDGFQSASSCELKIETTLGAAQILSYLQAHPDAVDFVVGIDELMFQRGKDYWVQDVKLNELAQKVKWNARVVAGTGVEVGARVAGAASGFFPLDYGALTFIYNKEKFAALKLSPPKTSSDLLKPEFRKKFILQDPRVSSPGMHFFTWLPLTMSLSKLRGQWLALAQSWDSSYQMFMQGEAPMVWSYLSSMAYHESKGQGGQYGYVDFEEGLPVHLEGMAKVKSTALNAQNQLCGQKWFEYLYSAPVQAKLVEKQWMLPVTEGVALPKSFEKVAQFNHFSTKHLSLSEVEVLLSRFAKEVQGDSW